MRDGARLEALIALASLMEARRLIAFQLALESFRSAARCHYGIDWED